MSRHAIRHLYWSRPWTADPGFGNGASADRTGHLYGTYCWFSAQVQAVTDHIRLLITWSAHTLPGEQLLCRYPWRQPRGCPRSFAALAALRADRWANGRRGQGRRDRRLHYRHHIALIMRSSTAQITVPEVWDVRRTIEVRTAALAASSRTMAGGRRNRRTGRGDGGGERRPGQSLCAARHCASRSDRSSQSQRAAPGAGSSRSFGPLMEVAVPSAWGTRTTNPIARPSLPGTWPWPKPSPMAIRSPRRWLAAGAVPVVLVPQARPDEQDHRISIAAVMLTRHLAVAKATPMADLIAAQAEMDAHFDASIRRCPRTAWQSPIRQPLD